MSPFDLKNRVAESEANRVPPKARWQAGTLTYTTGGLVALFSWLLSCDFAWQLKERSVGPVFALLLLKFGASNLLFGVLTVTLPAILSTVFSPIISYRSDRHRGKWGRRIPFLIVPTPIIVLSMVGLTFTPALGPFLHRLSFLQSFSANQIIVALLGFFWMLFAFASQAANAVFGGLINDVVPKPFLGRFFGAFRAFSLLAGIVFNFQLMGMAETHYAWIFLGIAAVYGFGVGAMCLKVKEGEYEPPPEAPRGSSKGFIPAAMTYFRECFSHPCYILFYCAIQLSYASFLPINAFTMPFAKSLGMNMGLYGKYIALTYAISLVLSYPIGLLADRFHPLRVGLTVQFLYVAVAVWGGLFAKTSATFGLALLAQGVLSGTWMTAIASLGLRVFPASRFAQMNSANDVFGCLLSIVLAPTVGMFLDYNHHVYRHTYLIASVIMLVAITAGFLLYRQIVALGGPWNYRAPEIDWRAANLKEPHEPASPHPAPSTPIPAAQVSLRRPLLPRTLDKRRHEGRRRPHGRRGRERGAHGRIRLGPDGTPPRRIRLLPFRRNHRPSGRTRNRHDPLHAHGHAAALVDVPTRGLDARGRQRTPDDARQPPALLHQQPGIPRRIGADHPRDGGTFCGELPRYRLADRQRVLLPLQRMLLRRLLGGLPRMAAGRIRRYCHAQ